jgi:hypothetical protein
VKILKHLVKEEKKIFNMRLTEKEIKAIKAKADLYYGGNMSGFMKHSALNWTPRANELTETKK